MRMRQTRMRVSDFDPADDEFWLPAIEAKNERMCVMCQLSV
jgi:hypothetical protein